LFSWFSFLLGYLLLIVQSGDGFGLGFFILTCDARNAARSPSCYWPLRVLEISLSVHPNMSQSRISKETWEQLKISYIAGAGLRELARKMNIPEGTVLAHAKRNGWTQQIEAAKQQAKSMQSNAITPVEALATTLNERKDKSRLHLSKYVVDASERAAQSNGNLEIAGQVQKVAQVHGSVWPEEPQQGSGVVSPLSVYSRQTVISIQTREPDSQPS
jgi:hypothetical protein